MQTTDLLNDTDTAIEFSIDGRPGTEAKVYKCAPGKTVEVPVPYVESGLIERLAPGLVPPPADPKAAKEAAKAEEKAAKEAEKAAVKAAKGKAKAIKAAEGK